MKSKPASRVPPPPLAEGQIWRLKGQTLQLTRIGNLFVHYRLGKPGAVRVPESISSKVNILAFLKKNQAVLAKRAAPAGAKK